MRTCVTYGAPNWDMAGIALFRPVQDKTCKPGVLCYYGYISMPDRTTIVLPLDLKERAVSRARAEGISFAEFVRRAVEIQLNVSSKRASEQATGDPFLDHLRIIDDAGPADWSTRVDEVLYGAIDDELRGHRGISRAASEERPVPSRRHAAVAGAGTVRRNQ